MPVAQRLGQALLLPIHDLENRGVVVGPAHADLRIEDSAYLVHLGEAQSRRVWTPRGYQVTQSWQEAVNGEIVGGQDETCAERFLETRAEERRSLDITGPQHGQDGAVSPSTTKPLAIEELRAPLQKVDDPH